MDVHLLGPVGAVHDGRPLALGAPKPRAVLAVLALRAGETVSAGQLVEALWAEDPPPSARKLVQHYVSALRRALGPAAPAVATSGRGYRLDGAVVDALRFEGLIADGRPREALELWRGAPLADVADEPFAAAEVRRLEELRLQALELAVEEDLTAGRHASVVAELERLVAEHPLRERLHAQRMVALYRCGRQADALEAFRQARRTLVDEVGVEPGPELQRLHAAVLAQDASLAAAPAGEVEATGRCQDNSQSPSPPPQAEARRLVAVVAFRIGDARAGEDPELAHARRAERTTRLAGVVEAHGGRLQDAVTAVFGVDEAHDDDALRAARVAASTVGLEGVGAVAVDAGTAFVAGGVAGGGPVASAAALAATATDGEVRLGAGARQLLGGLVEATPIADAATAPADAATGPADAAVPPGGTAAPGAWRLDGFSPDRGPWRGTARTFVGREDELAALEAVVEDARVARACRTAVVVGPAGIGKSRLLGELAARLDDRVTTLAGRCPGYGEGRTFRALTEAIPGLDDAGAPEEVALQARRRLEALGAERAVLLVVEDLHVAETPLLDVLDYLAAFVTSVPVAVAATARPELVERRPGWAAPAPGRRIVTLAGLAPEDAQRLATAAGVDADRRDAIVSTADGNPLFVEQLAAVSDAQTLPLTLHAVLAARLDRLDPDERTVLQAASVVGSSFAVELVATLAGTPVTAVLPRLVRRGLVAPEAAQRPDEDRCRFAHALIREAAYEAVPRRRRSSQHEQAARWLAGRDGDPAEVGRHLALAHAHDLAPGDERGRRLAADAATQLERAATEALDRADLVAGVRLLEDAVRLRTAAAPPGRDAPDAAGALLPRLGAALIESGRIEEARGVLEQAAAHADPRIRARAAVELALVRLHAGPELGKEEAGAIAENALGALAGDELGQCRAWRLKAIAEWTAGRAAAADAAWQRAAGHARKAGERRERNEVLGWSASAAAFGPMPVAAAIERCVAIRKEVSDSPVSSAVVLRPLALLHALSGDLATARTLVAAANERLDELGRMHSSVSHHEAMVELLAGDPAIAERRLRADYAFLESRGEHSLLATTAAMLAQAVLAQGRHEEAEGYTDVARRLADADDGSTQALWRACAARVRARDGDAREAERLALEAVAVADATDGLLDQGEAYDALAEALAAALRHDAAAAAAREARERYERKGAVALLRRYDRPVPAT